MSMVRSRRFSTILLSLGVSSALALSACATTDGATTAAEVTPAASVSAEINANDFPVDVVESTHPAKDAPAEGELRVTLLGTGSPVPSTERFGFSILVQAGDMNYLVDAGRGAVIRLTQAGVEAGELDGLILTHYHSDHVLSVDDLWMTGYVPAFGGRDGGDFMVYGPEGVGTIVDNLYAAFENDRQVRAADGELDLETTGIAWEEFTEEGVVLDRDGLTVTMFDVQHDPANVILPSQGYRIDYGEHSVLISGDTIPHPNVVEHGKNVDLLIHEVAAFQDPDVLPQVISHHTTPEQAGEIFRDANPGMAVYTHFVNGIPGKVEGVSDEEMISRTKENFDGEVVLGEDLMVFTIGDDGVEVLDQQALSER
ncbi:MBL fold metallo-hydrolase [Corynebacterium guangdongense]|uniref:Ribonuclease Z n=1 Tax=Corynebacterium guangdongense TaxID=1783348 RepID=A0ABU2A103_9CORY|nr:MBL fold metallo-hydrolase [Corynebacterium guangdongense]MDR7330177.1 ribonuclease Z [Corynebacterium guangdongense]WJZ18735.1 Ribonuclease Z [Corynebacterium guangdongense]